MFTEIDFILPYSCIFKSFNKLNDFLKNQRYQHIFHGPNMIPHIFFSKVICNRFFIFIFLANHLHLLSIQMPSISLSIEFWRGQGRKMYISGSCLKKKKKKKPTGFWKWEFYCHQILPRCCRWGSKGRNSWGSHRRSLARPRPEPLRGRPGPLGDTDAPTAATLGQRRRQENGRRMFLWWFHFKVFHS